MVVLKNSFVNMSITSTLNIAYREAKKSRPLQNYQAIVLNRIKACH